MEQRTLEWFEARRGKVTASRVLDAIGKNTKGNYLSGREKYLLDLAAERLSIDLEESPQSADMKRGSYLEDYARSEYEVRNDIQVVQVGLIDHPSIKGFGASPDGMIGNDGLIEIKCPKTQTHLNTIATGQPQERYMMQMYAQMACTGRDWCDFVSYDPRLPPDLNLYIKRITRDDDAICDIENEVIKFLVELDEYIELIKEKICQ